MFLTVPDGEIDVLAIGETLVDFISQETVDRLREADTFRRYLGGSPANIAVYVAKLGRQSAVISKTGIGAFGQFLKGELRRFGVNTDYLIMDHRVHTSIVFVSRTTGTPDFEALRDGDFQLSPHEIAPEAISQARIVHASTFALSREPCRSAVFHAFRQAAIQGKVISFDPNYSPIIWPNQEEAKEVIGELYGYATITKPSIDDSVRLFGDALAPEQYIDRYHALGPRIVILTMGKAGSLLSVDGNLVGHLAVRPVQIVDATGAGDSYWAGFLSALLDGHSLEYCMLFGREIVEMKLTTVGPLPATIDRFAVARRLPDLTEAFHFY